MACWVCCTLPTAGEAAEEQAESISADGPFFEEGVQAILKENCLQCHGSKIQKAELDLSTREGILEGSESGPIVEAGDPEESLLYEMVSEGLMPPEGKPPLSEEAIEAIRRWIESGVQFDPNQSGGGEGDPEVTQHDVIPLMLLRCTVCHGLRKKEAGLDLRTKASMLRGGKSGPAFVPGRPEESLILKRILAEEMPPRRRVMEVSVKPMGSEEVERLTRWIASGAPEVADDPDLVGKGPDRLVSEEDRDFWAFQPPQPVEAPRVRHADRVRNAIDAFILEKLEAKGLSLSPEADRLVLIRRASFDLTGLPPTPEEISAFLDDTDPMAYEKLVHRLLSSPRYGERWGRHWLDVAGYSDSEGITEQDLPRPHAYRYRDYVIRALNADKPYDRFLLEQIAGDELADYESAEEITPELYDNLVATGFLGMAPDGTWANVTAFVPDRLDVIANQLDVLGAGVMGLTIHCARCHSHKFDPIPQRDYYRLAATLKGAYDEHDWLKPNNTGNPLFSYGNKNYRLLPHVPAKEQQEWEASEKKLKAKMAPLKADLKEKADSLRKRTLEERLTNLPEEIQEDVRKALETDAGRRDQVQKYLVKKLEESLRPDDAELKELDEDFKKAAEEIGQQIEVLEKQRYPRPMIRAIWDRGEPSPTYLLRRGSYLTPGRLVGPGVPSVLTRAGEPFEVGRPWPGAKKTGRRLALAKWLTNPDHPLTARVLVNRVWKHHFQDGIVESLDNFGRTGAKPTHPELLDWLTREFVDGGWSLKALHRLIMTSSTYRQLSTVGDEQTQLDPVGDLLASYPMTRMEAEVLRDTLLFVSGRLDETPFGSPDRVEVRGDGLVTSVGTEKGWRRSIYVEQRRKDLPTILENFDLPQMNPNCLERRDSTVVTQALHLMNNAMVHGLSRSFAEGVVMDVGDDPAAQIEKMYLISLSRFPTQEEKELALDSLAKLTEQWAVKLKEPSEPAVRALANVCHAMLNSAEFIYID